MSNLLTFGVIILATTLMFVLAIKTDLLKDISTATPKPYSLARTQLAFWTLVIFCSFVYLWHGTNIGVEIGTTALTLLGVSSATTVVAGTIDAADRRTAQIAASAPNLKQNGASRGFLWDILSDSNGIAVHRVQNVLFTVVMLIAFVMEVWTHSKMPEFSNTLLTLSGVSAASYIGVKLSENKP